MTRAALLLAIPLAAPLLTASILPARLGAASAPPPGVPAVARADAPAPHWAFRAVVRPVPPSAPAAGNPIDAFLLARLARAGFSPSPEADRLTLLRRVTFDLTGLPPTPAEAEAYLADGSPGAYERLVDRLLASPAFGERIAQHWLDVARYAETNGYEADAERPQAWRYRDWVVGSFNADLPYDRFLAHQLAGDLLARGAPPALAPGFRVAAGFNRCGPVHQVGGNVDPAETRQEVLTEMVGGLGGAFLGLTLTCARCHDHKFDPISLDEYYRLEAYFSRAQPKNIPHASREETTAHARAVAVHNARLLPLRAAVAALDAPYRSRLAAEKLARLEPAYRKALDTPPGKRTPEQQKLASHAGVLTKVTWDEVLDALTPADRERRTALRRQQHEIEADSPQSPPQAWTLEEDAGELASHVLRRGNLQRKGPRVGPAIPAVLKGAGAPAPADRVQLAAWLTHPDHPLTARVMANRLWQWHFGQGLVRTANDFGVKGEPPSHPELLDWLARELVEGGWELKRLHRLIVTSAAYRRVSGVPDARTRALDPDNRLLSRMNRRRLEGEAVRDAMQAAAGTLTPRLGGPSVRVPLEPEVYDLIFTEGEPDGLWLVTPDPAEHTRRSLYLFNKRTVRQPLLESFDQPDTLTSCPVRPVSTFAPQALVLLNGPFAHGQSRAMARRLLIDEPSSAAGQVRQAFWRSLGRAPSKAEARLAEEFLTAQRELLNDRLRARRSVALPEGLPAGADPAHAGALADLCLALFNRNAFVHVD